MGLPRTRTECSSRARQSRPFAVAAVLALAACGGNGQNGGNGNGGNPAPTAQSCGGTVPDAQVMANWTHRQGAHFAYFIPDPNWLAVESTNSIDISSPTGDAIATFAFAYGVAVPTTLPALEDIVWMDYSDHQVISTGQIVAGGPGQEQTIEFTGTFKTTGQRVHGIFTAGIGPQQIQVYRIQANEGVWAADGCTLLLVESHITYLG